MSVIAEVVGNELLAALQIEAEAARESFSAEDRLVLERAFMRLAVLVAIRQKAVGDEIAENEEEIRAVVATLRNFRAVAALVLARASGRISEAAATILGRIARGLLVGALIG